MSLKINTSTVRQYTGWLMLIAFVCLCLVYLNKAFYAAWLASESAAPYSLAWSRRAAGFLCFSGAALALGLSLFLLIRAHFQFRIKALLYFIFGLLLAIAPNLARFVWIDNCLDQGGRWSEQTVQCSNE